MIVNAVLWDTTRADHIICRSDLKRLKKNAMIIDISCDEAGAIETTIPTSFDNPTYVVDGILHYAVDHIPSLLFKSASCAISEEVSKYVDDMIENKTNSTLEATTW
ncbi:hypothetical protein [Listeria cornellensis]|uniref:hypothetical protein n=1 Tax=Listeria cornellensis TaxID=1494961 RepID=UPI0019D34EE1|nr:hypothetical protein [Listeria cornellensis]